MLNQRRRCFLSVRLSQEEWCQLDSLLINLKVPMYNPEKGKNYSQSERFRMLLEVLAPEVEHWHWLKWSRLVLGEDGGLRLTRSYPHSSDEDIASL